MTSISSIRQRALLGGIIFASIVVSLVLPAFLVNLPSSGILSPQRAYAAHDEDGEPDQDTYESTKTGWGETISNIAGAVWDAVKDPLAWVADSTFGNIFKFITWMFYSLAAMFLTMCAAVLDLAISFSIDRNVLAGVTMVQTGWTIMRDFSNILFIFILLYIAIATILNIGNYKRAIVNLIIAALLINFSLFFTKLVIDASNIFAVEFYNRASLVTVKGVPTHSLSAIFTDRLKLTSIVKPDDAEDISNWDIGKAYIFGSLVVAIAGFVFLGAGVLFVVRTIALIFLMILSPLAFAAMVLPGTQGYARRWWSSLLQHSFVAPVFLFFIYVVSGILKSGQLLTATSTSNTSSFGGLFNMKNVDDVSLLLVYIIILGLIVGSVVAAREVSGNMTNLSMRWAGAIGGGTVGYMGRRFVGGTSQRLADSRWMKEWASKSAVGRTAERIVNRGASATYDFRGVPGTGTLGLGGAGGQGGYRKYVEEKKRGYEEQARRVTFDREGKPILVNVAKRDSVTGKVLRDKKTGKVITEQVSASEAYARQMEQGPTIVEHAGAGTSLAMHNAVENIRREGKKATREVREAESEKNVAQANAALNEGKDPTEVLGGLTNKEVAKLDKKHLATQKVADKLSRSVYRILEREGELTQQQLAVIKESVDRREPEEASGQVKLLQEIRDALKKEGAGEKKLSKEEVERQLFG